MPNKSSAQLERQHPFPTQSLRLEKKLRQKIMKLTPQAINEDAAKFKTYTKGKGVFP